MPNQTWIYQSCRTYAFYVETFNFDFDFDSDSRRNGSSLNFNNESEIYFDSRFFLENDDAMEAPLRFVRKQRDLNKIGRTVGLNLDFSPFCYTLIYGWTEATKVVLVKAGGYGFGILGSWVVGG